MHPRRKGYSSLDELYNERDAISWYWRLAALASSWMILAGYLILPSTFDTDPHLRFSRGALAVIIAILLTCGYSLTVLLYFFVQSWLFQSESIFYPALCSSALGLLGTLYAFASSPSYDFNGAAGATVALSTCSAAVYALLLVWVQRKINRVRKKPAVYQVERAGSAEPVLSIRNSETYGNIGRSDTYRNIGRSDNYGPVEQAEPSPDGRESQGSIQTPYTPQLYQDPSYYRNYLANMHPTAVRNPSINTRTSLQSLQNRSPSPPLHPSGQQQYYDPTNNCGGGSIYNGVPATSLPNSPFINEDDLVNQQMARLLLKTNDTTRPGNQSQSTFHIDWRTDDDDEADPAARGIQMRTRTGSGSRLIPPNRLAAAQGQAQGVRGVTSTQSMRDSSAAADASRAARLSPFRGGDSARDGGSERGRRGEEKSSGARIERAKSREERRKEIELGNIGAQGSGGGRRYG